MAYYNVCVGNNDFIKNAAFDLTNNRMYAMRFDNLQLAQRVATAAKAMFNKTTIIDEFGVRCPQDLLEYVGDKIQEICGDWAADIDIDYNGNRVLVFDPDGIRTYELKLTTKYAE